MRIRRAISCGFTGSGRTEAESRIPLNIAMINPAKRLSFFAMLRRLFPASTETILLVIIVLITFSKLQLGGQGFLSLPDERRGYYTSEKALEYLRQMQPRVALSWIFSPRQVARPLETIINFIPLLGQHITAMTFNLNRYESRNSYPLFAHNFIIYLLVLSVHYLFSRKILRNRFLALISLLLLSSLTNSYLYLRHALPYNLSLLVFYTVIYKTTIWTDRNKLVFCRSALFGVCSMIGFLIYPGYFPLVVLCLVVLVANKLSLKLIRQRLLNALYFGAGSAVCLLSIEALSRLGWRSYYSSAKSVSRSITQGSFEESLIFIFKYLYEVERVTGLIMIVSILLFAVCMLRLIRGGTIRSHSTIVLLGAGVFGLYLFYGSMGFFFHRMTYYGRLIHQYIPFLCILTVFTLDAVTKRFGNRQRYFWFSLSFLFVLNYSINFYEYKAIAYPKDVMWSVYNENTGKSIVNVCEYENVWYDGISAIANLLPSEQSKDYLVVVNACFYYPVSNYSLYRSFDRRDRLNLLKKQSHFINHKAYQYEGYDIKERRNLQKMKLKIKVFSGRYDYQAIHMEQAYDYQMLDPTGKGEMVTVDYVTGLMWASDGKAGGCNWGNQTNWREAVAWAEDLIFAGYSDWRLPGRLELESIVNYGRWNPAINTVYFPNSYSSYYWTSSISECYEYFACSVNLVNGRMFNTSRWRNHYVRAVRGPNLVKSLPGLGKE